MTVALIPARSGSKGVKNKNIKTLGGYPLIHWSIEACKKTLLIDRVIVSTDSEEYADIARELGAEVPFLRPNSISNDLSSDYEFINHAIEWMEYNNCTPEIIAHIRPTTPFRDPKVLDRAISIFKTENNITSLRSIHKMSESSYKTFELDRNSLLKTICNGDYDIESRNIARQEFPSTYIANGYVDLLSTSFIKQYSKLHGERSYGFLTDFSIEVDTIDDFNLLESQLLLRPEISKLMTN